jgi:hypothetical protein
MAKKTTPAEVVDDTTPVQVDDSYTSASRIFAQPAQSCGGELDTDEVVTESETE